MPTFAAIAGLVVVLGLWAPEALGQGLTTGTAPPGVAPRVGGLAPLHQFLIAWAVALVALAAAYLRRRHAGETIGTTVLLKANHLIPAVIQVLIFSYWALYWEPLSGHLWALAVQLVFAFTLDLAVGVWREGTWRVGLAPVPVVLSANLFVWFTGAGFWLFFLLTAIALLSKALVRRDGGHIFNPSALGLSVVGLLCIPLPGPDFCYDIAHELNVAPSMTEFLLVVALIAQLRVPIALVSLGAASALWISVEGPIFLARYFAVGAMDGLDGLVPTWYWAPVLLVLALLATDPRTIPKTGAGRLVFGFMIGMGIAVMSGLLTALGYNDFMAKVLPIPLANLLGPWCERVGARLDERLKPALESRWNYAHVTLWFVLSALSLSTPGSKASLFEDRLHAMGMTRHMVLDRGAARCELNPAFCEPFAWGDELSLWTQTSPPERPDQPDPTR